MKPRAPDTTPLAAWLPPTVGAAPSEALENARAELLAAGVHCVDGPAIDPATSVDLVRDAPRSGAHVVVLRMSALDDALLRACAALEAADGPAVAAFVDDADPARMALALRSGVHAYEVHGWQPARLLPVLQQALERARLQRDARNELQALQARFDERKLVDRAKGILMQARQISEDEAFAILRSASMHGKQRVGQVSQQLIAAAGHADAINRAGQLRMLSQRLVKLLALIYMRTDIRRSGTRMVESRRRCIDLLQGLRAALPEPGFVPLLAEADAAWTELAARLEGRPDTQLLAGADAAAERLQQAADGLVEAVQQAGQATSLRVVNLCGRQRMLSQRVAKQALLDHALNGSTPGAGADATTRIAAREPSALRTSEHAFSDALLALQALPLSNPDIRRELADATEAWQRVLGGASAVQGEGGRLQLAEASEQVLDLFERLTARYEHSMQVLLA